MTRDILTISTHAIKIHEIALVALGTIKLITNKTLGYVDVDIL